MERVRTVVNDTYAILRAGLVDGSEPHWVSPWSAALASTPSAGRRTANVRYPALGPITGDWGGGFGLGLEVLWHAIRAEDGRGPATGLAGP